MIAKTINERINKLEVKINCKPFLAKRALEEIEKLLTTAFELESLKLIGKEERIQIVRRLVKVRKEGERK